ncbi:hypothetical protein [Neisseria sicca]|uniref:hypothetical protein n=1 Tax=Neisseria sicca TaxID=490 RepID=UPI0039658B29
MFQHTAARRRLVGFLFQSRIADGVSTHSRPKAAGILRLLAFARQDSFNTQPPEGGWAPSLARVKGLYKFQHTAARRRLGIAV